MAHEETITEVGHRWCFFTALHRMHKFPRTGVELIYWILNKFSIQGNQCDKGIYVKLMCQKCHSCRLVSLLDANVLLVGTCKSKIQKRFLCVLILLLTFSIVDKKNGEHFLCIINAVFNLSPEIKVAGDFYETFLSQFLNYIYNPVTWWRWNTVGE